jgi:hypothetical protein
MAQLRDTEVSEETAVADYNHLAQYNDHNDDAGRDYDHHNYSDNHYGNACFYYHDYAYVALVHKYN